MCHDILTVLAPELRVVIIEEFRDRVKAKHHVVAHEYSTVRIRNIGTKTAEGFLHEDVHHL